MHETELIMTTGPCEIHPRVLRELNRPAIPHYHPEFYKAYDGTCEMLKTVFKTTNEVVILPGSGRIGIESSLLSILEPGDNVLSIENGIFGTWISIIAERIGAKVTKISGGWGKSLDIDLIEEKVLQNDFKLVTVVHSESSTGAKNPIKEVGKICDSNGALYMVDAVSSLGGINIETDKWKIDLCCTASQKCLAAPMGLSIVSVSNRAWDKMLKRKTRPYSWSLDLLRWREQFFGKKIPKAYPVNPSTHLVYALREAVNIIIEEGLEKRYRRHKIVGKAVRDGIRGMGLILLTDKEKIASDTVTAVILPDNIENNDFVDKVRKDYKINLTAGLFPGMEQIFRIGHMGTVDLTSKIIITLHSIYSTLSRSNVKLSENWVKDTEEILLSL